MRLVNVEGLSDLGGLDHIEELFGSLRVYGVPPDRGMTGVEKVTRVDALLEVEEYADLETLNGLAVTQLGSSFSARDNASLTDVEALRQLGSIVGTGLVFQRNPKLQQCDVDGQDAYLRDEADWDGELIASDNATTARLDGRGGVDRSFVLRTGRSANVVAGAIEALAELGDPAAGRHLEALAGDERVAQLEEATQATAPRSASSPRKLSAI